MSNNAGAFSGGAGVVDDILGQAYLIVKHIYDNLGPILEVANRTTKIDLIKENLDLIEGSVLSSRMATILEVIGNYRSTLSEAADIPIGSYFSSGDSGEFKIYLKEAEDTYTDVGNLIEPLSSDFMDELSALYADMQANLTSSLETKSQVEDLKADVIEFVSQVEDLKDLTETLKNEAVNYGNAQVYESWAALNAIGIDDGTHYAFVLSSDEGTHLDPVTGVTVLNSGFYKESLSPVGWQRVSESESSKAAAFATESQEWAEGTEPGGPGTKSAKGQADRAEAAADEAAQSAIYAGGFEVPLVASQAVGNATIANGRPFRVAKGTTPETFDWYQRNLTGSGSVLMDPLATTAALSANGGAALVKSGAATTVQQRLDTLSNGRSAPHNNFSWFTSDFTVTGCGGPGQAALDKDIADVFQAKFGASIGGLVMYVDPTGNDSNDGSGWGSGHAVLTLNKALRLTTSGVIMLRPGGTYEASDFRYTDAYGDHPKKIICPGGRAVIRFAGDDPAAKTWTLDGDYGGIYSMCMTAGREPLRVLKKDILDKYGNPYPVPFVGQRLALASVQFGYAHDPAAIINLTASASSGVNVLNISGGTKNVAVGMAISGTGIPGGATITAVTTNATVTISANTTGAVSGTVTCTGALLAIRDVGYSNVQTNRANFDVIYGDAGGNGGRMLIYGVPALYMENIDLYGYHHVLNVSGQPTPQLWRKNCRNLYGNTHAVMVEGGYSYEQDCTDGYCAADGANYNALNGVTARGAEINKRTIYCGDALTFTPSGTGQPLNPQGSGSNKNGSSNHDSYVVRVNGEHLDCFGPNIADTATSYSWNLGVRAGYNALPPGVTPSTPRYGILNQGNNAWLDACKATGQDVGLNSDSAANVRLSNTYGTQAATNGGTFTAWSPV